MISLFLDTSSCYLTLGILENNRLTDEQYTYLGKDMSKDVVQNIKDMLLKNKLVPQDIDKIICVNGPGSFTGLRIGVTIAKTYAWALNKYVIPVSTLYTMASSITNFKYIIPIIDARRNYVFAGIYDNDHNVIMMDQYISKDNLKQEVSKLDNNYVFVAVDEIDGFDTIIYKPNIESVVKSIKKDPINPHYLVPVYLKKTEAEENLGV